MREIAAADSLDPYRLVLMDWHMPGMNGLQASRIIKRNERLQHIPKIVMDTSFGQGDVRAQAEEIGIDSYLLKPVNQSLLYDTLVDAVTGTVEKQHLDGLSASINDFDFDAALLKLDEIANRCRQNAVDL